MTSKILNKILFEDEDVTPLYMGILENGSFVPQKLILESVTETGERIPQKFMPKDMSDFSDTEKDKVALKYKSSTYSL